MHAGSHRLRGMAHLERLPDPRVIRISISALHLALRLTACLKHGYNLNHNIVFRRFCSKGATPHHTSYSHPVITIVKYLIFLSNFKTRPPADLRPDKHKRLAPPR
jgi:hypothetical protein